jgi:GAF domain-containing protein
MNVPGQLARFVPESLFVIFAHQPHKKGLSAVHMSKEIFDVVTTLQIPFAQQLSGWVAANRETVANSDSHLDLRELSSQLSLKKALCTPIASGTILFGVLSIYRKSGRPFTAEEIEYAESLSRAISTELSQRIANSNKIQDSTLRIL